jgi:hypothetical protein
MALKMASKKGEKQEAPQGDLLHLQAGPPRHHHLQNKAMSIMNSFINYIF